MLSRKGSPSRQVEDKTLVLGYRRDEFRRETRVKSSVDAELDEKGLRYRIRLAPQSIWSTDLDVDVVCKYESAAPQQAGAKRDSERSDLGERLREWLDDAPKLRSSWEPLEQIYQRSLVDLAALRFLTPVVLHSMP